MLRILQLSYLQVYIIKHMTPCKYIFESDLEKIGYLSYRSVDTSSVKLHATSIEASDERRDREKMMQKAGNKTREWEKEEPNIFLKHRIRLESLFLSTFASLFQFTSSARAYFCSIESERGVKEQQKIPSQIHLLQRQRKKNSNWRIFCSLNAFFFRSLRFHFTNCERYKMRNSSTKQQEQQKQYSNNNENEPKRTCKTHWKLCVPCGLFHHFELW